MRWLVAALLAAGAGLAQAETPMIGLARVVEFDAKSALIRPDQALVLQEFVCRLTGYGDGTLFATGESSDDEGHLQALSAAREASVRVALDKLGVNASRFSADRGASREARGPASTLPGRNLRRVTLFYNGGSLRTGPTTDCTPSWQRQLRAVGDIGAASISQALVRDKLVLPGALLVHVIKEKRPGLLQELLSPAQRIAVPAADRDAVLREAARSQRLDLLKPLIAAGLRPLRPETLTEALELACRQPDMVRALLAWGAPPESTDRQTDPLYCAASAGNLDSLNLLLAAGASPNLPGGRIVAIGHRTEIVRRLIEAGADPRMKLAPPALTHYDLVTLFHSYRLTTPDDVRWLLGLGLDINERTPREQAPLGIAANYATDDVLDAMLASGAQLIELEGGGLVGQAQRNPAGQLWLMRHGASVSGQWLLFSLVGRGNGPPSQGERLPVLREAIARGANINARDHNGRSVLAAAIEAWNVDAVEAIVRAGAELEQVKPGLSALELARKAAPTNDEWRLRQSAILRALETRTGAPNAEPRR
jgi:ankyrin repeat protein